MQTIACVAACQIDEAFAANLQQIRKMRRSEDNSTGPLAAHKQNICIEFEFNTRGGGAWESNPPSTRKLAEQPF